MQDPAKENPSFHHVLLFLLTVLTTLVAGALQQGINPLKTPLLIWKGIPFSFSLLLILGTHELGHYFISRRHGVRVTLPYFIPAPSFIGTFGAVIKMRSPILDRRALLDVGVAGPFAGLAVAVPVLVIGLSLSEVAQAPLEEGISLGNCVLFSFLARLVVGPLPEGYGLILHPVAFSGWIGLLVTSLNLLPAGQLDGGHVAYAMFGNRQKTLALGTVALLFVLGLSGWTGWLFWAALLSILGIPHPPVVHDWIPLDGKRKAAGWVAFFALAVTFMPVPF
ncbi:MAG TPA: site-2 protease family protein [Syntrophales bacterium]|nr:site-2 protease family protein [Syntrophales bacterium]HQB29894.1 site-2 protease family protein [Syntrophales bacterium]